jgi:hypothetical protein
MRLTKEDLRCVGHLTQQPHLTQPIRDVRGLDCVRLVEDMQVACFHVHGQATAFW